MPRISRSGAFYMTLCKSAVAGQQRWFFTTRTAWQLIQLLGCREAVGFRLLVDDLWCRAAARVLHRWLGQLWLVVTGWAAVVATRVFATRLAITRCAVARAVLASALWLTATGCGRAGASARSRSAWTTATALGRFGLGHVVDAVTEVIHIVVEELVRRAVGAGAGAWRLAWLARLTLFAGRGAFTGFLLAGRAFATAVGWRFFLAALVLALVATTTAATAAVRAIALRTAWVARVTHVRTLAHFRLLGLNGAGIEAHQVAVGNFLLGHAFDAFQQFFFVRRYQGNGFARTTGAAGTADTVYIVFVDVWQLEVDHVRQLVDIQAACGDIGGHHDAYFTGLEVGQRFGARVLALVAVDGDGGEAVLVQVLGQAVGAVLGAGEHQHLFPGTGGDQVRQQRTFVAGGQAEHALLDTLDRGVRRRDFDAFRVVQQLAGQGSDVVGERCREQQVLTFGRQAGEDLFHVMDKAHVEHAVGFVQHEDFHVGQIDAALAAQVEQATRAGDEDVNATGHGLNLWVHADAAEDAGADELQVAGIQLEAVMHLGGEFAGRGQDQYARLARAMTLGLVRVTVGEQPLQNREGEAAGFTSTCLSRNHQVATLQHGGNGPLLHRSRLGIARCLDGAD